VKEYYKSGKLKLIGKTSKIIPIVLEGQSSTYYPSGTKQQLANYKSGKLDGDVYNYYPNGALYLYAQYVATKIDAGSNYNPDYIIIGCRDSTGKQLAVNGNGHYIGYDGDFKNVIKEGELKAGLRDGSWSGNNGSKTNYITYSEEYDNGKFLSGRSVDQDNKMVTYTKRDQQPQYKG
jgi:antitoxin component YwqK of YwqJK toxin-antitoxin module